MKSSNKKQKHLPVFVYGTLMPGFGNHHNYLEGSTLSEDRAVIAGTMYSLGGFPAIKLVGEGLIKGYVMNITPKMYPQVLKRLDFLEGYSENDNNNNMYNRSIITATLEDGKAVECYVYSAGDLMRTEHYTVVENGDWLDYVSKPPAPIKRADTYDNKPKFKTDCVVTALVKSKLTEGQIQFLLYKHFGGNWGDVAEEDAEMNNENLKSGEGTMMSVYSVGDKVVWVYTEHDRSVTTVLFPHEW